MVTKVPVPVVITPPGLRVTIQVPVEGNPVNITLPVGNVHVVWVIAPISGADGVSGCGLMIAFEEGNEVQPTELVTVNVYVVAVRPVIVVVVPVPIFVVPPGLRIIVHVPLAGKPLKTTLPVAAEHVGWVIAPTTGDGGLGGIDGITIASEFGDVHPSMFVTE